MPYTNSTPSLPFSGKTPISRHNSAKAAQSASVTAGTKLARYLEWLRVVRQCTDWGTVDEFGWPMSTVCSVRNAAVDRGLVIAVGDCLGKYGKRITIWSLREP